MDLVFKGGTPWVACGSCGLLTRLAEVVPAREATGRRYPLTVLCHPPPPRVVGAAKIPKRIFLPEVVKFEGVCVTCSLDLSMGRVPRLRQQGSLSLQVVDRRPRLVKKS